MKLKLVRISKIALAAVLLCAPIAAVATSSNVISAKTAANKKTPYHYSTKAWTKKLAKAGYSFKLPNAAKGALYKPNGKPYGKKSLKKIVKSNTLFKVKKVRLIHNNVFVDLVSKNGKFKGYTSYINGIYNKNLDNPKLQPLIEAELGVMTAKVNQNPTADLLGQAQNEAAKLTGKEKKIADLSLKQLKEFVEYGTVAETPVLLIGRYPGSVVEK